MLQVNHALLSKKDTLKIHQGNSIGVLDIFGFEDFGLSNRYCLLPFIFLDLFLITNVYIIIFLLIVSNNFALILPTNIYNVILINTCLNTNKKNTGKKELDGVILNFWITLDVSI